MKGRKVYAVTVKAAEYPGATRYAYRYYVAAGSVEVATRRVARLAKKDKLCSSTICKVGLVCVLDG